MVDPHYHGNCDAASPEDVHGSGCVVIGGYIYKLLNQLLEGREGRAPVSLPDSAHYKTPQHSAEVTAHIF